MVVIKSKKPDIEQLVSGFRLPIAYPPQFIF
nr:MAG TPA: hypothetical protein [Caudoviricetes sp.]